MAIKSSGPLALNGDIVAEFTTDTAKNLGSLRGVTWYVSNVLTTGTFSSTNLTFSGFYGKRATDPAGASSIVYEPGTYTFEVPLFRTSLVIDAWGGGGGGDNGGGRDGENTTVTSPAGTLTASAGKGGGGGGRRSTGPGGAGGAATGGDINESGAPGGIGSSNAGGNSGGQAYGGGAGGISGATGTSCGGNDGLPGDAPGGGGGGVYGRDCSKDPGWSYSGGGGGGGFVRKTYTPVQAPYKSTINITVGAGSVGNAQSVGAAGRVVITWS